MQRREKREEEENRLDFECSISTTAQISLDIKLVSQRD